MSESKTNMQLQISEMNKLIQQMALHIGIYQSVVGDLPGDVVQEVVKALNPTFVPRNMGDFIQFVRDTAAKLAQTKREAIEAEGESHSPYSEQTDAVVKPLPSLDSLRSTPTGKAPSVLWTPPSRP